MSFLEEEINLDELPFDTNSFEPLPPGWYTASIADAEVRTTRAGTGKYISVKYGITGPSHQGRFVFGNLNIKNPNPKAEEIGRQQLGNIMRAIGLTKVNDTDQLIGGDLSIKLKVTAENDNYAASNDVSGFKAITGSLPTLPKAAKAEAPPWANS